MEHPPDEPASSRAESDQPAHHESRKKDESRHAFRLRDRDLEDLRRSGLTEETIRAAGISFVTESVSRQLLHRNDLHGDGYAFPYVDLTGRPILQHDGQPYVNIKLDTPPCDKKGRPQKYLKPTGEPNYLYIPPGAADAVCDATHPLLFTEGEKKALKATQEGFPCLALPGVWGFRTRKGLKPGTSLPLPQLDAMLMSGRDVFIIFDSDLATNVQVQQAERAFGQYVRARGAKVYSLRLPAGLPGGPTDAKVGLDDFLQAHGPAALHAHMEQARTEMPCLSPPTGALYRETPQGLFRLKRERDGLTGYVQLTNFTARVVEELQRDDGAEAPVHVLRITGSCQGRLLPPVDVSVAQYASMTWPNEKWGLAPAILPPSTNKDYVRHALQVLSADSVQTRRIFTHTGWRRLGERWVYFHAGGGIGMEGVDVELARELARYTLPAIPDDPRAAILRSLAFLDVAPRSVTVPLLAAVYLAPLVAVLSPKPGFCPFL
ncbi:MAG TPA: DUF3854 domain-containing protein, partial [Nitrospiraceae bacterium]|nr:DUF3854 domain-containing protein [Nitrospiraceae bacterium]